MSAPVPTLRMDTSGTAFGAAPTWTDYTSSLLLAGDGKPISITWGRQDEQAEPQPRQCSFLLKNVTGAFTPGNAAAPAGWDVGARVNVRLAVGASTYDRFDGYVDSILPTWPGGVQTWNVVEVNCTDLTARLAIGQPLESMAVEEILSDSPAACWPLDEGSGAQTFGDASGNASALTPLAGKYGAGVIEAGQEAFAPDVTSVAFRPGTTATTQTTVLAGQAADAPSTPPFSFEFWFVIDELIDGNSGTPSYANALFAFGNSEAYHVRAEIGDPDSFSPGRLAVTLQSRPTGGAFGGFTSSARLDDKLWHHCAVTVASDGVTCALYIDGDLDASTTLGGTGTLTLSPSWLHIGGRLPGFASQPVLPLNGRMAAVAIHGTELSAARILEHYQAGAGTLIESTDNRYARIANYAGVTTSGLPTGRGEVGYQQTSGVSVTEALATVARSEGTVSFVTGAGALTFQARDLRYDPTSTLALTADDLTDDVAFRRDRQGFANEFTVSRQGGASQRVVDTTSQAAYGRFDGGSLEVVSSTDYEAMQIAAFRVAVRKVPQTRTPSLTVDLLSQPSSVVVGNVLNATISTYVTVTALPTQAPASSVSLFVEGGQEQISPRDWTVGFFTSPALPFQTLRADAAPSSRTKLDTGLKIPL